MLEELDNDSNEDLGMTGPESANCLPRLETQSRKEEICFPMQLNSVTCGEKSPNLVKGKHQKTSSSQFEQKRFYETELDTLKTELEKFAK
jgi:hypothetical protein